MTRKIVFKKTSDPEILSHIQKGATEVKSMFGRKAFALEIKSPPQVRESFSAKQS